MSQVKFIKSENKSFTVVFHDVILGYITHLDVGRTGLWYGHNNTLHDTLRDAKKSFHDPKCDRTFLFFSENAPGNSRGVLLVKISQDLDVHVSDFHDPNMKKICMDELTWKLSKHNYELIGEV